jgi:hypothetical protein
MVMLAADDLIVSLSHCQPICLEPPVAAKMTKCGGDRKTSSASPLLQ